MHWQPTNQWTAVLQPYSLRSKFCKGVKQWIPLACIRCPNAQEISLCFIEKSIEIVTVCTFVSTIGIQDESTVSCAGVRMVP